jgi:5'-nucleotidase / UDP-sugar diphosphatase
VKKLILIASLALVPLAAGCDKNKKAETQPSASISDVTPPAPTHNGTAGSTWSPSGGSSGSTPVTPITYDQSPSDSQFASNTGGSFGAAAAATTSGRTYKVQRGDTLWSIAKRTYGDGAQYKKIVSANPSVKNDRLIVGQTLQLP